MSLCPSSAIRPSGFPVLFLRSLKRLFQRRQLIAQCRDLLIEHLHLGQSPRADGFLSVERSRERAEAALGVRQNGLCGIGAATLGRGLQPVAFAFDTRQACPQPGDFVFQVDLVGLLQREQFGEL